MEKLVQAHGDSGALMYSSFRNLAISMLATVMALCSLVQFASAQSRGAEEGDLVFQPARITLDSRSLAHQIGFPRRHKLGEEFSVSVVCVVRANRQGRLRQPVCIGGDEKTKVFEQMVISAVPRARLTPAKVRNRRKRVLFTFTTIFSRQDGESSVSVAPHQFLNHEKFGDNYIAPQLITSDTRGVPRTCRGTNALMRVTVSATGLARDAEFHGGDANAEGCTRPLKEYVNRLRYIPGFVAGTPTEMQHLLVVSSRESWIASRTSADIKRGGQ